jgi:hypothetical protein
MNRHREPRGGRSLPFAVSKEQGTPPAGSWAALCPSPDRRKARKQIMHGATAATAAGYQLRAAPTPLTEQAIATLPCEIILSLARVFFAVCLLSLLSCYELIEAQEREASTWQVPLVVGALVGGAAKRHTSAIRQTRPAERQDPTQQIIDSQIWFCAWQLCN